MSRKSARRERFAKNNPKLVENTSERARTEDGQFIADDPSTPDVNEAFVSGKAPVKKKTTKKKTTKKKKSTKKK